MNIRKLLACLLAAGVMAGALTACGTGDDSDEGLTKVEVSEVTHSIFYAPMYAAVNNGYFQQEGLEIELTNAGGADKVMTSLLTGAADIGFAGPEAVVYVYAAGRQDYPKVFAQLTACDGSFLVGRDPLSGPFSWESLRGATILPGRKGGIPYMTLLYCLNQRGMQVGTDVYFDESISFDAMTGAFVSGTGDYVTVFEPGATDLEMQGRGYILASIGEEGGTVPYTTYFANADYIRDNADIIERFTRAIYKGQQFVATHTADEVARAISYAFPDTDMRVMTKVVQRYMDIGAYSADGCMAKEDFDRLCRILKNAGELEHSATIDFEAIVDNTFAEKVKD